MDVTHDRLVEILRSRYDYYSARSVLIEALEKQKIAVKAAYPPAEVEKVAEHLVARNDRTDQVAAYVRAELKPAAAAAPAPPPPPPPAAKPAPAEKKA